MASASPGDSSRNCASSSSGTSITAVPPAGTFGSGEACVAPPRPGRPPEPSASIRQRATSQSRFRTSCRFSSTKLPGVPSTGVSRTGSARAWCSNIAGFGVRSGKTMPSATKLPSLGTSPKSPPYAQRKPSGGRPPRPPGSGTESPAGRPVSTDCRMPWSQNSQMKPPCSPGVVSKACQYSARLPLLLPIAWEYSHWMSGCRCFPERACATIASIVAYIGQVMSLAVWSLVQSNMIAPS